MREQRHITVALDEEVIEILDNSEFGNRKRSFLINNILREKFELSHFGLNYGKQKED